MIKLYYSIVYYEIERGANFMLEKSNTQMINEIKDVIISSRNKIAYEVNNTML